MRAPARGVGFHLRLEWCCAWRNATFRTVKDPRSASRIPSLDGFRAISILLVIAYHLADAPGMPEGLHSFAAVTHSGALGVRIFFAISGFLITTLLVEEYARTGDISLRRFYFRRTLRILPPYYVFLLCAEVAARASLVPLAPGDRLHAWTFTMNFHTAGAAWTVVHSWSLSIEEQFYLVWPALLLLAGPRRARPLLLTVIVVVSAWRFGSWAGWYVMAPDIQYAFRGVADWLAAGALLALLRPDLQRSERYRRVLGHAMFPVVTVVVAFAAWTGLGFWRRSEVTLPAAVFGTVLLLDWGMSCPRHPLARLLNWAPVAWLGRLSYSLYIWQQVFFTESASHPWEQAPFSIAAALLAATISYYVVERPVLDWRAQVEPRMGWLRRQRERGEHA